VELSEAAKKKVGEWQEKYRVKVQRPSWDEIWLAKAFLNSKRSHDGQTKCGCVLVRDNVEVSGGYNGFIDDIDDSILPNIRLDNAKYPWMMHSEENALLNAAKEGRATKGSICYVTGMPCLDCSMMLYRAGIVEIVTAHNDIHMIRTDEEYNIHFEIFKALTAHRLSFRHTNFDKRILANMSYY